MKKKKGMYEKFFKRAIDFLLSLLALIVLSPVLLIVAILVRTKLGSPVIFTQERPGLNEKVFKLYKFRTMTDARDAEGNLLPDDVRLTKFGKLLRSTSLDELPELWNIVKGDMSIVGPRPLLVRYLPLYNERQKHRHDVRPGFTGLAQVNGRNALSWEEKFAYDVEYVNNISFVGDVKIIFKTVKTVLSRQGVNNDNAATMMEFTGTRADEKTIKKAVLVSCFDWYDTRLRLVKEVLQKENYVVTILTSDFDHVKKSEVENRHPDCKYIHAMPYKKNLSIARLYSHRNFAQKVYKELVALRPDLIYTLVPPNTVGSACAKYKQRRGTVKLVVDIIDLWPESMTSDRLSDFFIFRIWKNYRNKAIQIADYTFTECELYQDYVKQYLKTDKYKTLLLCKKRSQSVSKLSDCSEMDKDNPDKAQLDICYLGSINNIIDIKAICNVLYTLVELQYNPILHIIGDGESRNEFIAQAENIGCKVIYYGKVFDETEKTRIMSNCTLGINIMKDTVKVGLTIKSIDYFMQGVPIINNIKGDTWQLVQNENVGINFTGDVEKFKEEFRNADLESLKKNAEECFDLHFSEECFKKNIREGLSCIIGN